MGRIGSVGKESYQRQTTRVHPRAGMETSRTPTASGVAVALSSGTAEVSLAMEGGEDAESEESKTLLVRFRRWIGAWLLYFDENLAEFFGLNQSRYQWEIEEKRYQDWMEEQRMGSTDVRVAEEALEGIEIVATQTE